MIDTKDLPHYTGWQPTDLTLDPEWTADDVLTRPVPARIVTFQRQDVPAAAVRIAIFVGRYDNDTDWYVHATYQWLTADQRDPAASAPWSDSAFMLETPYPSPVLADITAVKLAAAIAAVDISAVDDWIVRDCDAILAEALD
jgi:hypothetical protein